MLGSLSRIIEHLEFCQDKNTKKKRRGISVQMLTIF